MIPRWCFLAKRIKSNRHSVQKLEFSSFSTSKPIWVVVVVGPYGPPDQKSGPGIWKGTHGQPLQCWTHSKWAPFGPPSMHFKTRRHDWTRKRDFGRQPLWDHKADLIIDQNPTSGRGPLREPLEWWTYLEWVPSGPSSSWLERREAEVRSFGLFCRQALVGPLGWPDQGSGPLIGQGSVGRP